MIRIAIVEDEDLARRLTAKAMRDHGFEVHETADAHACTALLKHQRVEAIVVDLGLPGIDGMAFVAQLRERQNIGVLIVTRNSAPSVRSRALDLGADDYLVKPIDFDELAARIRSVVRRRYPFRKRSRRIGKWLVDLDARTAVSESDSAVLIRGEFNLLARLIEANAKIVSREDLQSAIGRQPESDLRSVDALVSRLRRKLEDESKSSPLIVTAPGFGYRLREAAEDD